EKEDKLIQYDFIIVDEGQDLFDKGLDLFINKCSGFNGQGLSNGNSMILYDIDQSYSASGRNVSEIADIFTGYYSHFLLSDVKRSAQCPNIRMLSSEVFDNPKILLSEGWCEKREGIKVNRFKSLTSLKSHIVKNILSSIRDRNSSLK